MSDLQYCRGWIYLKVILGGPRSTGHHATWSKASSPQKSIHGVKERRWPHLDVVRAGLLREAAWLSLVVHVDEMFNFTMLCNIV